MGHPTKVQVIKRKNSEQWYVNFPAAVAHAIQLGKGEVVEWVIEDKNTLILKRTQVPQASQAPQAVATKTRKKKTLMLLPEILKLWNDARGAFKQSRVWARARRLGLSQLACLERHTMTGLLCSCGRQSVDWSADYRVFSKDQWEPNLLFRPVIRGSLSHVPESQPVIVAIDDTLLHKSSRKTPGVAYRRDPLSPPFQVNLILAQRFIQFSMLVPTTPEPSTAARAVPVRFEHVPSVRKPRKNAAKEDWDAYREAARQRNLNTAARKIIHGLRDELDTAHQAEHLPLILVVDGSYTNKTVIGGLPDRTTLIGRIRKDAKLHFANKQSPRWYGARAPTPDELRKDELVPWEEVRAHATGKTHSFRVKTLAPLYWRKTGTARALRVVVIAPIGYRLRKGARLLYRQPAYLICTDPDLSVREVVQYYLWRWDIEVNHRDEKQIVGVGQAQVWSPKSVDRLPAFAVASYSMLLLAAMNAFGPDAVDGLLPIPKWQRGCTRGRITTQQLVQHLRQEVWGHAVNQISAIGECDGFVTPEGSDTKSPEHPLAQLPPLALARSG